MSAVAQGERFGHPVGLWYLAFTEAWERFSYYGMQTMLVLYMVGQLLLPGHVENVWGFATLQAALTSLHGPLSVQATSSLIFGLYTGLVYLTPIFGGLLADRLLGKRRTITLGGLLMAAGHFLMAFDAPFLLALLALALGAGCFKGNIAAQLGSLYAETDARRAQAFQIFYIGISAGVIAAPIVCGTLGELYGWHYGFGAAGVGMLIGLVIYRSARAHLPAEVTSRQAAVVTAVATPDERRRYIALLVLLPILAIAMLPNQQIFNVYMVWGEQSYDFNLLGFRVPTTWLISLDAAASVAALAGVVVFWRWWARRRQEPDEFTKMVFGAVITAVAYGLVAAAVVFDSGKINLLWAVAFHVINSIGFAHLLPVGLSLYVRLAPARLAATIVGFYYLHLFAANFLVGWVGAQFEKLGALRFWTLHVAFAVVSALALLIVRRAVSRIQPGSLSNESSL